MCERANTRPLLLFPHSLFLFFFFFFFFSPSSFSSSTGGSGARGLSRHFGALEHVWPLACWTQVEQHGSRNSKKEKGGGGGGGGALLGREANDRAREASEICM